MLNTRLKTKAYRRGLAAGKAAKPTLKQWMEATEKWARGSYPASVHLNYWDECTKLDQQRMQCPPSTSNFPETKGLPDLLLAERKGFLDGCGGGPRELAFHYTWSFFCSRGLNTRYIGKGIRANNCSEVYLRDSNEGGPLFGKNLDDIRRPHLEDFRPPVHGPDGIRRRYFWTDSGAVLCDEEPKEIFPVDVWGIMPRECKSSRETVRFLQRYNEFWGPCTCILVDEDKDVVVIEKSNCRMGVRECPDGVAVITACSYLIPEMKGFRDERHRLSLKLRGWTEDSSDCVYWQGCDARHRRLWKLAQEADERGAMLDDIGRIMTDHAVPFPERICLAGERGHPNDVDANWTLTSEASVLEGRNRRTLFWRIEGNRPCYENPPFLIPGEGVRVKTEWKKGTRL